MKIMPEFEEKIRRAIRDAYALDPLMSVYSLQETLEIRFKRKFAREYLAKQIKKLSGQMRRDLDTVKVSDRLKGTRDTYRLVRERLLKVVYWKPSDSANGIKAPFHSEIIDACAKLVLLDLALVEAEVKNGIYQRPIDAVAKEIRYEPLPADIRKVVIASWKRNGLLTDDVLEMMVPKETPVISGLPMIINGK